MERPVDPENRLVDLLEQAMRATDPEVALHAVSALRRELDAFERVQAWRALEAGSSYGAVARALGISRQAAHRRYRELAGQPRRGQLRPLGDRAQDRAARRVGEREEDLVYAGHSMLAFASAMSFGPHVRVSVA